MPQLLTLMRPPRNPLRAWPTVTARLQSRSCSRKKSPKKQKKTTLECKSLSERVCRKTFQCAPRGTSLQSFSVVLKPLPPICDKSSYVCMRRVRGFFRMETRAKVFMETSLPGNTHSPIRPGTLSSDVITVHSLVN